MKLRKVEAELGDPAEEQYIVEEITVDDIAGASKNFHKFIHELEGFPFVNFLTVDEITAQARKRFTSKHI